MISGVLVNILHNANIGLVKGNDLFAEKGVGDTNVIISATNIDALVDNSSDLRRARINIQVNNYKVAEGVVISENICDVLEGISDYSFTYDTASVGVQGDNAKVFNYTIKKINIANYPVYSKMGNFYTINVDVFYSQE